MQPIIKSHPKCSPIAENSNAYRVLEHDLGWLCLESYLQGAGFGKQWNEALDKLTKGKSIKYGVLNENHLREFIGKTRADGVQRLLPNAILTYDESTADTYGGFDIEIRNSKLEVSLNT
jgi:hypothetical protein